MKLLAELSEKSLGLNPEQNIFEQNFLLRKSARAILLNHDGLMAVQHIQKYHYHKLSGGGMEEGEEMEETLRREIREEVGCEIDLIAPIGIVIEYQDNLIQISYCFSGLVQGDIRIPHYDEGEIKNNQQTIWMKPEHCLETLRTDLEAKHQGNFILQREIIFLNSF